MKRVLTAVVLIPLVAALIFWGPVWLLVTVAAAIALLAVREYSQLVAAYGVRPLFLLSYVLTILLFLLVGSFGAAREVTEALLFASFALLLLAPFLLLLVGFRFTDLREALLAAALSLFALPYIALPLALLVVILLMPAGPYLLIYLLVLVWSGDIAAYFVGRSLGRHLLAPRISPRKTWEGAMASLAASVVLAYLFAWQAPALGNWLRSWETNLHSDLTAPPWWVPLLLGTAINLAAQLGDLVESAIKRGAGLKDSGSLLPGHGGVLDRIDALLMASPVGVVLFAITYSYFIPPS